MRCAPILLFLNKEQTARAQSMGPLGNRRNNALSGPLRRIQREANNFLTMPRNGSEYANFYAARFESFGLFYCCEVHLRERARC